MRIWTISDLHLEVEDLHWDLAIPDADVCVLAGDISRPVGKAVDWIAARILPWMPVIYVPGNHEYYGHSMLESLDAGRAAARDLKDFHLLDNSTVKIGGVLFIGATLWTDYLVAGSDREAAMNAARNGLNDHRRIAYREPHERFLPEHALELHARSRHFIAESLKSETSTKVVVTHHCPHPGSIHPKYEGQPINAAFASDLSDIILEHQPDLWVHGHTHSSFDYHVGSTRVVCNPRGYGRENPDFRHSLVVTTRETGRNASDGQLSLQTA